MATDAPGAVEYLGPPASPASALAALADPVRRWFTRHVGKPTAAQRLAWPALTDGRHLLLSAPTGTGKTLAAFLPVISRLLAVPQPSGCFPSVRCLYVAPLKSLLNDARRNLRASLRGIRPFAGADSPRLRVGMRTGDTPSGLRRHYVQHPPDLFLTTPESLAVLLSQASAEEFFAGLRWVVVDEVHALAAGKRGADLALSLERLEAIGPRAEGPLQRIGLSATCAPLITAARFLAGNDRPCRVAEAGDSAPLRLVVEPLFADAEAELGDAPGQPGPRPGFLGRLLERLDPELEQNRTTLVFTSARGLAERLVWALRRRYPNWAEEVAVHHSCLSRARRRDVERRLKCGALRAVVSSTSLELGIDIGTADAVVVVHPPGGVVRLLQRVGRAGHAPGRARRGLVFTATAAELLEAAVTAAAGQAGQGEPLRLPDGPLDVLCQQLLGMAACRAWLREEASTLVRRAYPYRGLARADFDACLDYLSGLTGTGRPWLPPRLRWHGDAFTLAGKQMARILRRNLGTILGEEPRTVRFGEAESGTDTGAAGHAAGALIGQLDELFADRLQPGDRFLLDGRCLEYRRRHGTDLLVEEVTARPLTPRWVSDGWPLSRELARRLYLLRVQAAEALRDGPGSLAELLRREYGLSGDAAQSLVAYFLRQEAVSEIPEAGACLVELVTGSGAGEYYLHTPLNRAGNDVLARLAVWRLARTRGWTVTSLVADLGLALFPYGRGELTADDLRTLLSAEAFEADLDAALAESEAVRERFRRVALTGLMLLRNPVGGRRRVGGRDWPERRLFDKVRREEPEFVLLRQALRDVREDFCDAEAAREYLEVLPRLTVRRRVLGRASPFAEAWTQAAAGPVESAETPAEAVERLHEQLTGRVREPC
jgi:ATP-dependent Lhr-like helicase